jgi:hypothetical protein
MAKSFVRHNRAGEAAGVVPGVVRTLEQALDLGSARPWSLSVIRRPMTDDVDNPHRLN